MSADITFGDGLKNRGLLVGNNPGTVNIYQTALGEASDRDRLQAVVICEPRSTLTLNAATEGTEHQPAPFSTVPFLRDPDFVDRGDLLEQLERKLAPETARAALIGLGGIGYVTCMVVV